MPSNYVLEEKRNMVGCPGTVQRRECRRATPTPSKEQANSLKVPNFIFRFSLEISLLRKDETNENERTW